MAAEAFERRIPSPVRLEAGRSAARVFARIRRNAVISASHTVREDGTMAVRLALMDDKTPVFSFEVMVPNEAQAQLPGARRKDVRRYDLCAFKQLRRVRRRI